MTCSMCWGRSSPRRPCEVPCSVQDDSLLPFPLHWSSQSGGSYTQVLICFSSLPGSRHASFPSQVSYIAPLKFPLFFPFLVFTLSCSPWPCCVRASKCPLFIPHLPILVNSRMYPTVQALGESSVGQHLWESFHAAWGWVGDPRIFPTSCRSVNNYLSSALEVLCCPWGSEVNHTDLCFCAHPLPGCKSLLSANGRENQDWNVTSALLPVLAPSLLKLQHKKEKQQPFLQEGARNYRPQSLGGEYVCCFLIILALLFHKKIKNSLNRETARSGGSQT